MRNEEYGNLKRRRAGTGVGERHGVGGMGKDASRRGRRDPSLLLRGLGLSSSSLVSTQTSQFWNAPKLTYEQIKPRTEQPSPNAYIVDVREPDEVILGSIPSSVNIPLSGFAESLHLNPVAFKQKHGFEKPRQDQEVVFYCRSGKRSATASDIAKNRGYTNVLNYEGSWLDWTAREQDKSS
ncbi:Rhodanese-like domain-containing protein [Phellopilus nigrolimitatus]|nr:Rhodanese-like domain-containing protein [Phellopilus nigrolimitatus]